MRLSVVCTLIDNDTRHRSGQNLLRTHSAAAPRESTTAFITKSRMASSLFAIAFVPILRSVFKSKIGLRLPRKLVVFFFRQN